MTAFIDRITIWLNQLDPSIIHQSGERESRAEILRQINDQWRGNIKQMPWVYCLPIWSLWTEMLWHKKPLVVSLRQPTGHWFSCQMAVCHWSPSVARTNDKCAKCYNISAMIVYVPSYIDILWWRYLWIKRCVDARKRARTERGNTRGGAT